MATTASQIDSGEQPIGHLHLADAESGLFLWSALGPRALRAFGPVSGWAGGATLRVQHPFDAARIAIRSAGVEDGLPNPRVHATFLDSRGRLWVGTQEGAAFLGGGGWTTFPLPEGAPSTYIRAIAETPDGALWFGTESGGLWRYHKGDFRHWTKGRGLPALRVNALLSTPEGLLVGTAGGGLLRFQGDAFHPVQGVKEPLVWALATIPDPRGIPRLWVGGDQSVWVSRDQGWRRLGPESGYWDAGANAIAPRRLADGSCEVWICAWKKGVGRWNQRLDRFEGLVPGCPSRSPTSLAVLPGKGGEDEVWMGTYDVGLVWHGRSGWQSLGKNQGFPSTGVYSILANPGGRPLLWVGTRGAGLVSVDPAGWRSLVNHPSLPSHHANCFLETESGGERTFWIGTDEGLIQWRNAAVRIFTEKDGLPSNFITDLHAFEGPEGQEVWVGTLGGVARHRRGRWTVYTAQDGLRVHRVECLASERLGDGSYRIYVGGDGGLIRFHRERWTPLPEGGGMPANSLITSLRAVPDPDGGTSLWVGMRGGGVSRLRKGQWTHFGTEQGLRNPSVYGLAHGTSPNGRRWLWATMVGGGGLARIDMDRPEQGFQAWSHRAIPAFPTQGIQRVVVDPRGSLYMTSSRGVVRVNLEGPDWNPVHAMAFLPSDGLPGATSESGAIYLDLDGRCWVGSTRGVGVLDPRREDPPSTLVRPVVERVLVQGRSLPTEGTVRLGFRDQRMLIGFNLQTFHRHEAVRYRTQLLGLESEPQDWSPRSEREFTTLPPASYTLRIWSLDGFGRVTPPTDLAIVVDPAPWRTWWAVLIQATGVLGLAVLVVHRRHRALRMRAEELERTVSERTQALAQANEALHAQSITDPLTGLANRRFLHEQIGALTQRLRRRLLVQDVRQDPNCNLGFLILDLDHFKQVNDTHGHHAGDQVLRQVAGCLRGCMREGDLVIRWGGEEFLVVAVDADVEEVHRLAERIRTTIEAHPFDIDGPEPLRRTVSVGHASMPALLTRPHAFHWEQVVSLADQCLYEAKAAGRNRCVGLVPRRGVAVPEDVQPECTLRALLEGGWATLVETELPQEQD